MPLDAIKTTMQVQGAKGLPQVATRLKEEGVSSLYQGAVAQAVATAVSFVVIFCIENIQTQTDFFSLSPRLSFIFFFS